MQTMPTTPRPRPRGPSAHARLLSVLRGDKYMINAYPPGWRSAPGAVEAPDALGTKER
jgi:hypothetical protein